MESNSLSIFVGILRESLMIFLKNRSLMANIALFNFLLHSLLFSCNFLSIEPLIKDFFMKVSEYLFELSDASQLTKILKTMTSDFYELIVLQWFFIISLSMASLLSSSITISASSALTYSEEILSFSKDLLSSVLKSCKKLILTWFFISLFELGYFFLVFTSIFPFTVNFGSPNHPTILLYVILFVVSAFRMYMAGFWNMSIVVSVVEEKSGLESLGKASDSLKGFKLQGFLLSLAYGLPILILRIWGYREMVQKRTFNPLLMGLILVNIDILLKMLLVDTAFTMLYDRCKLRREEEEVELHASFEYSKVLSNEPMIKAAIP